MKTVTYNFNKPPSHINYPPNIQNTHTICLFDRSEYQSAGSNSQVDSRKHLYPSYRNPHLLKMSHSH
uniref:Uncharacterized protein n=1 Tax=Arundo donax TaxID=35708 RepID=A0A0A9EC08_ARUDO